MGEYHPYEGVIKHMPKKNTGIMLRHNELPFQPRPGLENRDLESSSFCTLLINKEAITIGFSPGLTHLLKNYNRDPVHDLHSSGWLQTFANTSFPGIGFTVPDRNSASRISLIPCIIPPFTFNLPYQFIIGN
jgi:hypothetical protein